MATDTKTVEKNAAEWATGGDPMTDGQKKALKSMCERAGVQFDDTWTKAEASQKIDELKEQTGR